MNAYRRWRVVLVAVLSWPGLSSAQVGDEPLPGDATFEIEEDAQRRYRGSVWGDVPFYSGNDLVAFAPIFGVFYTLPSAPVAFEGQIGAVAGVATGAEDSESTFRPMNPFVAAHFVGESGHLSYRVGAGISLPLASTRDGLDGLVDAVGYLVASGMWGLWSAWNWAPEEVTLVVPLHGELRVGRTLILGADLGLGLIIPTGNEDDDTNFDGQLAIDLAYQSRNTTTGLRFAAVWIPDGGGGDDSQLSVEPYLRFAFGDSFLRASLLVNLDAPAGFSFVDDHIWAIHLGGGTNF